MLQPQEVGDDPRLTAGTALVPAGAGRRLVAWIIDGLLPSILMGVAAVVGITLAFAGAQKSGGQMVINLTWPAVLIGVASLLSLAYWIWLWLSEAKKGTTPGNSIMGLRTTTMEGGPAGMLAIFLRYLIVAVGSLIPYVGTLLVIISNAWDSNNKTQGWHDKVAHTVVFNVKAGRNPLETGGVAGRMSYAPPAMPGISAVSSPLPRARAGANESENHSWASAQQANPLAAQHQQSSWNAQPTNSFAPPVPPAGPARSASSASSAAPATATGPVGGSFAPPRAPDISGTPPAPSPPSAGPFVPLAGTPRLGAPSFGAPAVGAPPAGSFVPQAGSAPAAAPSSYQNPGQQNPAQQNPAQQNPAKHNSAQHNSAQHNSAQHNPAQHNPAQYESVRQDSQGIDGNDPEGDLGSTRIRPVATAEALRLTFDDGGTENIGTVALIGRNPAGYDGEMIERLVSVQDSSRSVSKTHLHVRVSNEGLWVTDRNSTNGSAITHQDGARVPLPGGTPLLAEPGARVHFGDRSFVVGRV
ncbi:RDD family protein [Arthrobacter cryoconiti]